MADEELIRDRRAYERVVIRFPVEWSDHYYEWQGECTNFGAGGCFVVGAKPLKAGKKLSIVLQPMNEPEVELDGKVSFSTSLGMGLSFDVRAPEDYERTLELFERIIAVNTQLALQVKNKVRELRPTVSVYPTVRANTARLSSDERRLLGAIHAGRELGDLRRAFGEAWYAHVPWVFALIDRDVLTTNEKFALPPGQLRAFVDEAPPPGAPVAAGTPAEPPSDGPTERQRVPQAEKYFQRALEDLKGGNRTSALINAKLALMVVPDDEEIQVFCDKLDKLKPPKEGTDPNARARSNTNPGIRVPKK